MADMIDDEGMLTTLEQAHLRVLYRAWTAPLGPWQETLYPDSHPLPNPALNGLIEKGWVKAGRGVSGPLRLRSGYWVVALTPRGAMIAKLNGLNLPKRASA